MKKILFEILVAIPIAIFAGHAAQAQTPKKCRPLVKVEKAALKELRACLDTSYDAEECKPKMAALVESVRAIHQCLPPKPKDIALQGSYDLEKELKTFPECTIDADNWKDEELYSCIAEWDYAAGQSVQLRLLIGDCSSLVAPFMKRKKEFHDCVQKNYPKEKLPLVKAKF